MNLTRAQKIKEKQTELEMEINAKKPLFNLFKVVTFTIKRE